jgi:hypothetical protein
MISLLTPNGVQMVQGAGENWLRQFELEGASNNDPPGLANADCSLIQPISQRARI